MTDEPELDDDAPYAGTQILWGRVLVLLSALALAFWLGTTFGGDDGSRREVRDQADEIARLQAQIAGLEAEIEARDAADSGTSEQAGAAPSDVASAEASQRRRRDRAQPAASDEQAETDEQAQQDEGEQQDRQAETDDQAADDQVGAQSGQAQQDEPRGRRYVVQSGDSLAAIAQEVYGDPTQWRTIARANDLREPYSLTVGEALRIPPSP